MPDANRTIGRCAQIACQWEVLARKAGNVCPGREFPDLTVADFLASAAAIAPVLEQAPHQPLGVTILRSIEATRKVVGTNTNLGIVLLLAPLASVPLDEPLASGVARVLGRTSVEDSRNAFAAIRLARPGGLGDVPEQDVKQEPTLPLRDVMRLAMDRDMIAAQYTTDFDLVISCPGPMVASRFRECGIVEQAIVEAQIEILSNLRDSLILRKAGPEEEAKVRMAARALGRLETPPQRQAYLEFDAFLRADNHRRNPGTTADLIAAALFVGLRDGQIDPDTPFAWRDHPFAV